MKKIKVEDAIGLELCHDITAMYPGFKGPLFKRGHVIKEDDVSKLLDIGKQYVYVGEMEEGMLHEEDCARRLAASCQIEGAHYEGPSEGKVLLLSDIRGMFRVDVSLLRQVNSVGDVTITTLPDHSRVEPGDRLASMRIVPLYTDKEQIGAVEKLVADSPLLELYPYKELYAGVIITGSEIYNKRREDRFEPVIRQKLAAFPGSIKGVEICDDDTDMIVSAAKRLIGDGADFLIFTGGMSVDPDDLTPGAIKRLGADIIGYGVPAQPGNMTLVAYLDDIPILGVPGAAISLPTTILDVFLPQIYTGLKITKQDMINLGAGGLCRMCDTCHFPNCSFGRY